MTKFRGLAMLALVFSGCGDDVVLSTDAAAADTGPADATSDAGNFDAGTLVQPPVPATLPSWTCRPGWRARSVEGVSVCEPAGDATECPVGEARFARDATCQPIDNCDARELPADVVYVAPGASGAGTESAPADLDVALDLEPMRPIALAPGRYLGPFNLREGATLIGRCVAETVLSAPPGEDFVVLASGEASVSHLRVEPVDTVGVAVMGELHLESVAVSGAMGAGVVLVGGTLDAQRLSIQGTSPRAARGGMGLLVQGGVARGADWFFSDNTVAGLYLQDGEVEASDVVSVAGRVVEPLIAAPSVLQLAGRMRIDGADLRDAVHTAIDVRGGELLLRSLRVDATRVTAPSTDMLSFSDGATVTIEGAFVEGRGVVFRAQEAGQLTVRDALVLPASSESTLGEHMAFGIVSTPALLERIVVRGGDEGLIAQGAFDFNIPLPGEPEPPPPPPQDPVLLTMRDVAFFNIGAMVRSSSTLTIVSPVYGSIEGIQMDQSRGVGLSTSSPELSIRDFSALNMQPSASGYGAALLISNEATVSAQRVAIQSTHDIALQVLSSSLTASDVSIHNARERPCDDDDRVCRMAPGGIALGVYSDASLELSRFELESVDLCGLQVARGGRAMLRDGRIADAEIGACIQTEGFDVSAITNRVAYEGNGTNIENTEHAIPAAPAPAGL